MTEKAKKYLSDIVQAIAHIDEFLEGINDFDGYSADQKTQSAVERQLGIIGEAVNRFRQLDDLQELQNSDQIVGFRNRLIHQYDGMDQAIVWTIIHRHLPALKAEAESGLAG